MLAALMPLPMGGPTNQFYESWADYLQPVPAYFLKVGAIFGHWVADLFYDLANAVLTAWNAAWKLADFSTLFTGATSADDMTGYHLVQYIGIFFTIGMIIMAIMMGIQMFQFALTSGKRGKEWPSGIFISFLVIAVVPLMITTGNTVGKAMNNQMLGGNQTETAKNNGQNILTEIWRNNTVDLKKLAEANFDTSGKKMHDFSPITDRSSANIVKNTVFESAMDDDQINKISNKADRSVFKYKAGVSGDSRAELDKGTFFTGNMGKEVYPRIKTNWMGIIAAEIVFAFVGFFAIIELLVRFVRIAYYSATLLVFAFRDMEGKKAMQIMHLMEGSIVGVALSPLSVMLFFGFIQYGLTTVGNLGVSWGPYTILSVSVMVAGAKALMGGFAMIDDWTGVPTGHGSTATSLINAVAAAGGVARGVESVGRGGYGMAKKGAETVEAAAETTRSKVAAAAQKAAKMREGMYDSLNDKSFMPNMPVPGLQQAVTGMDAPGGSSPAEEPTGKPVTQPVVNPVTGEPLVGSKTDSGVDKSTTHEPEATQTEANEKDTQHGFRGFTGPNGEPVTVESDGNVQPPYPGSASVDEREESNRQQPDSIGLQGASLPSGAESETTYSDDDNREPKVLDVPLNGYTKKGDEVKAPQDQETSSNPGAGTTTVPADISARDAQVSKPGQIGGQTQTSATQSGQTFKTPRSASSQPGSLVSSSANVGTSPAVGERPVASQTVVTGRKTDTVASGTSNITASTTPDYNLHDSDNPARQGAGSVVPGSEAPAVSQSSNPTTASEMTQAERDHMELEAMNKSMIAGMVGALTGE